MRVILLGVLLLWMGSSAAQESTTTPAPSPTAPPAVINAPIRAAFDVDNISPLLGEPFIVTLEVTAAPEIEIVNWVSFEMPLEILEEGEIISETLDNGDVQYTRDYQAVLWDVGEYLSPEVVVSYDYQGQISGVPVASFYVQVPIQISNPEEASLRPAVAPIDADFLPQWVYIAGGIAGLLILMLIARLIQISQRGMVRIVNASPAERAIAEIEDLKHQNLPPAAIVELVALSLRQYLTSELALDAIEMTTAELSAELRQRDLFPKPHSKRLLQVLEQADLVKFARFQPDEANSVRLVNFAVKWVKETERLQRHG